MSIGGVGSSPVYFDMAQMEAWSVDQEGNRIDEDLQEVGKQLEARDLEVRNGKLFNISDGYEVSARQADIELSLGESPRLPSVSSASEAANSDITAALDILDIMSNLELNALYYNGMLALYEGAAQEDQNWDAVKKTSGKMERMANKASRELQYELADISVDEARDQVAEAKTEMWTQIGIAAATCATIVGAAYSSGASTAQAAVNAMKLAKTISTIASAVANVTNAAVQYAEAQEDVKDWEEGGSKWQSAMMDIMASEWEKFAEIWQNIGDMAEDEAEASNKLLKDSMETMRESMKIRTESAKAVLNI